VGKRRVQKDSGFGRRLKQAMAEEDMQAKRLAELEKVGVGTVSRWRRGELPDELRYPSLASHLGVRVNWLKSGQGTMRPSLGGNGAAVREVPVAATWTVYTDVRPPMGEQARRILEERIEAVIRGAPLTPAELDYWLKLVRWAATSAGADVEASRLDAVDLVGEEAHAGDRPRPGPERPGSEPQASGG